LYLYPAKAEDQERREIELPRANLGEFRQVLVFLIVMVV